MFRYVYPGSRGQKISLDPGSQIRIRNTGSYFPVHSGSGSRFIGFLFAVFRNFNDFIAGLDVRTVRSTKNASKYQMLNYRYLCVVFI
jgi:hypothetical protein